MKNIVIIGGSRGIGHALARYLSPKNNVLVLARNKTKLDALKSSVNQDNLMTACIDLTAKDLKSHLFSVVNHHFDHVDILINNAGYLINKPFLDLNAEDIAATLTTNVTGLFQSCQALVPLLKIKGGHIVNIGSMGGFQGSSKFPGLSIYSASKAAVASLSECLAEELKSDNIQVNCLALGAVQTEMLAAAFPGYEAPTSPEEMAQFIGDFSLTANQYMNGKIIPVSISTP